MSSEHHCASRDEVRDAILDAVGRMLVRYGYRKMTVEDIAHEAGIGKGTVYLYFSGKEEVALGWFDRGHSKLHKELKAVAQSDMEPDRKIEQLMIHRVLSGFDVSQQFAESLDELFAAIRPAFLARREQYQANMAAIIADVLKEGHADGIFDVRDVDITAHSIVLSINSLLPYSLSVAQLGNRDEIETKIRMIADLMLNGLRSRSSKVPGEKF